jgi:hypothetical protein
MAELSIIEFIIYGLVGYPAVIMLILSAFQVIPDTKNQSVIRAIWILPAIIMMYVLASAGATIWLDEGVNTTTIGYNTTNTNQVILNSTITSAPNSIILVQPVWVAIHGLFGIMLIIYFIWNMLQLFIKRE